MNPLALAVLALLREAPMHPYEMAAKLKERGKDRSIKLRFGSLYSLVDSLVRDDLIAPTGRARSSGRPERTVFHLTPVGRTALDAAMALLLSTPIQEFPRLMSALSLMMVLPPVAVASHLRARCQVLAREIADLKAEISGWLEGDLQRVHLVEEEFRLAMLEAEHRFVGALAAEISEGGLEGIEAWRDFHGGHS